VRGPDPGYLKRGRQKGKKKTQLRLDEGGIPVQKKEGKGREIFQKVSENTQHRGGNVKANPSTKKRGEGKESSGRGRDLRGKREKSRGEGNERKSKGDGRMFRAVEEKKEKKLSL